MIVVVCVVGIGRYYMVTREIEQIKAEDARRVIGSDKVLLETVQNLENTLAERIAYQFVSDEDPLDLTKVITSMDFLRKLGADKKDPDATVMRLAATVVGDDGSATAVIRYLGTGHILRVGDVLEGWEVKSITKEEVKLARGGQTRSLVNRPIRETLQAATGTILSVRPMSEDAWQSVYTDHGYPGDVNPSVEDETEDLTEEVPAEAVPDSTEAPADSTQSGNR